MIDQPQANVELPAELAKAIERARNIVTVNEAEALRLEALATSSRYTVNELHKEHVELEGKVDELKKEVLALSEDASAIRAGILIQAAVLKDSQNEALVLKEKMDAADVEMNKQAQVLDARSEEVKKQEFAAAAKLAEANASVTEYQEKAQLIKDFASKL